MEKKDFNILICGVGGQGILTLKKILGFAAIKEKKNFLASELHGLSQRQGSVTVHFRLGEVFSPLISENEADLILSLDLYEAKRNYNFAQKETTFVINDHLFPFLNEKKEEIKDFLKKKFKKIYFLPASKICQEKLKSQVFAGVFLLGFLAKEKILPLKESSLIFGIENTLKEKGLAQNKEAFNLGKNYA